MNKWMDLGIVDSDGYHATAAADWVKSLTADDYTSRLDDIAQIIKTVADSNYIVGNELQAMVYTQAKAVCGSTVGSAAAFGKALRAAYERVQLAADNNNAERYNSRQYLADAPAKVQTGPWKIDGTGVHRTINGLEHYAATHPIILTGITAEQGSGTLNYELSYRNRAGKWCNLVVDKKTASDPRDIVSKLAPYDTGVTTKHGYDIVDYLAAVSDSNPDMIIATAIDALGSVDNYKALAPYVMAGYKLSPTLADSQLAGYYGTAGDANVQLDCLRRLRYYNRTNAILMDAMLSSMAMPALAGHTYIINPYAATSTGKSAIAAVCASLYGYCGTVGTGLVQNYNQTNAYQQTILTTARNLPIIYDDVKSADNDSYEHRLSPYNMCSGVSNGRNRRVGVSERTKDWCMVILLPNEYPLCDDDDTAGGAQARVLNIPLDASNPPVDISGKCGSTIHDTLQNCLYHNYGWPAQIMAEALCDPYTMETLQARYQEICHYITNAYNGVYNSKHVESIASIIAISELADAIIWHTCTPLTVPELLPYIRRQDAITESDKQYAALCDWITANAEHCYVDGSAPSAPGTPYGRINSSTNIADIVIATDAFKNWAATHGWSAKTVRANLARNGKIKINSAGNDTYPTRVGPINKRCIRLTLPSDDNGPQAMSCDDINNTATLSPTPVYTLRARNQ